MPFAILAGHHDDDDDASDSTTLMWREPLSHSSRDPLDCFMGDSELLCDELAISDRTQEDANKYAKAGCYIKDKMRTLLNSEAFLKLRESNGVHEPIARVSHSQIELGEILGGGAFSNVYEIKTSLTPQIVDPNRCVVKVLRKRVLHRTKLFTACAIGLLREGSILASLQHPNVIGVQAFSQMGPSGYATGRNDACFIVLDKLQEILTTRLETWKEVKVSMFDRHRKSKNREFFLERLTAGQQLACALTYLHEQGIVHRDIKPNNIGFDHRGILKLFDFDVSRIMPEEDYPDQVFKLTKTGTKRYMSPECGLGEKYNRKTDVYSFAILLHHMLSLEIPFCDLDMFEVKRKVMQKGHRPKIHMTWPKGIRELFKASWCRDISERMDMLTVHSTLSQEICKLQQPQKGTKLMGAVRTAPVALRA